VETVQNEAQRFLEGSLVLLAFICLPFRARFGTYAATHLHHRSSEYVPRPEMLNALNPIP